MSFSRQRPRPVCGNDGGTNAARQPVQPTARFANPAAERALLGALANRGRRDDLALVDRQYFTVPAHRVLFDAIARRLDAGEPIDDVLLANDVRAQGISYVDVFGLFDDPGASVPAYVPLLRDCRMRQMLHSLGICLTARAGDAAWEPRDVLRWLERLVGPIPGLRGATTKLPEWHITDAIPETQRACQDQAERDPDPPGGTVPENSGGVSHTHKVRVV
jgi:hypothetical protein